VARGTAGHPRSLTRRSVWIALAWALATALALSAPGAAMAGQTYTVNTVLDLPPLPGECSGLPGACSLRQALDRAQSGDTVIVPASVVPYLLLDQKIPIRGGVLIQGAGSSATTISGGGIQQAFELLGGAPVTIAALTIEDTVNDSGQLEGGAINGQSTLKDDLVLDGVAITDSSSSIPGAYGGAVETGSVLTVRHSRFSRDSAPGGGGGAIDLFPREGSALTVSDSVFEGDSAGEGGGGALLVEKAGSLSVSNSTFSSDTAVNGAPGGAIQLDRNVAANVLNSTFWGNTAGSGGAISSEAAQLTLLGDTLAGNGAEVGANLAVSAGGAGAENTIFSAAFGNGANCSGKVTSAGHNLEDTATSTCGLSTAAGDVVGMDPLLGPPAGNSSLDQTAGGPPDTLALAPGSPAIGAGSGAGCAAVGGVDERAFPRPGSGAACDVGAFEWLPPVPTATSLTASAVVLASGTPVTLTAAVAPLRSLPGAVPAAGGTVEFTDGGLPLAGAALSASGQAVLTVAGLSAGVHSITAVYQGDAVHGGSSSAPVTEQVTVAPVTPAPRVSSLAQSHRRWREGSRLATLSDRRGRPPVGTTFSFTLNTPSTVVFSFTHLVPGRRVRGRCVAPRGHARHGRACGRTVTAASLSLQVARAGTIRLAFQGRLTRSRRLPPGDYTVVVIARSSYGQSPPERIAFTILKG
jgi:Bacterial Ig-like domain (group 3)